MYLKSLRMRNFRRFSDIFLNFDKRLTVLVGPNGAGKSSVLEAATIAVGTLTSMMGITNYGIKKRDAHYQYYDMGSGIDVQEQFPIEIEAVGMIESKEITWQRSLNSAKGRGSFSESKSIKIVAENFQNRLRNGDSALKLPIISYYGTGRLWAQHRGKRSDAFAKNTRTNGYIDSLDGAANDKLMMKWFQKMAVKQNNKNISEYIAVCDALKQAFINITKGQDVDIQFNLDTLELDITYKINNVKKVLPLSQFSDGYKCTLSLIADIAYRMAILNPQLLDNVLKETEGIVFIDEIDLHLHPAWQQRILEDLMSIFPKVQFIVTTHAPAVVNSVSKDHLLLLKDDKAVMSSDESYGKDVNTIFREIMEVAERPIAIKELFDKFYDCLDNTSYDEAQRILDEIEFKTGGNDTELNACRTQLSLEIMGIDDGKDY